MRTRTLAAALLLAVAPCALPMQASAQGAATDDPQTVEARARFKEGVDLYDKGQFDQARVKFLQAYMLKKHSAILLNLAWSCLKSGHAIEAEKYFKQFLAEGKDITDKQRADANDGLTQSRARLGRIDVTAAAGTEVTIDGEKVGTAPLPEPVVVEAGAHTVKFKGPDGATDTQSVSVLAGEKAIARFGKGGSTAPPPPPPPGPASPPPTNTTSAPPSAPPADTAKSPDAPPATTSVPADTGPKKNLFAPPKNPVPAFILGGVAGLGFIDAIVFYFAKTSAQSKADDVANQIHAAYPNQKVSCNPVTPPTSQLQNACKVFTDDNNNVNTDALIANIGLGVGIVGLVGAGVYWVVAEKKDTSAVTVGAARPRVEVTPMLAPHVGGLSVSGSF